MTRVGRYQGSADVPFHVRVVGEQFAVAIEGVVVGIAEAADEQLDEAAVGVGANDRAAGALIPTAWPLASSIFGRDQLAVVVMMVRAGRRDRPFDERMIADHDVDQPVGAEHRRVRSMLAHAAFELDEHVNLLGLAIAVGIGEPIERGAGGSVADGEHVLAERQNALAVLHEVAERRDRLELAVMVFVLNRQQRTLLREAMMSPDSLKHIATSEPVEPGTTTSWTVKPGRGVKRSAIGGASAANEGATANE